MHRSEYDRRRSPTPPATGLPPVGTPLGPWELELSAAANDRYWAGAGVDHPARHAGVLYPPMLANLMIVALQRRTDEPLLHLHQQVRTWGVATAPGLVRLTGEVVRGFAWRGREALEVRAEVSGGDGARLWTGTATFCTARRAARASGARTGPSPPPDTGAAPGPSVGPGPGAGPGVVVRRRSLRLDLDLLRTYSRRGNFHSEPELAARLGYPAPVAQGMQVAGPAFALLLEAWGEALLTDTQVEVWFRAPVLAGQTVTATARFGARPDGGAVRGSAGDKLGAVDDAAPADDATFVVRVDGDDETSTPAVTGTARRRPGVGAS